MINKEQGELIIIGNANWDYYYDEKSKSIYAFAKVKGCHDCYFGDLDYLKRITRRFGFTYKKLTEKGKELGIDKF